MTISAKGRYALYVMIDLAENNNGSYIPMKVVAERQGLPFKYFARIMPILARNHVVDTIPGKSGGYRLNRKPEEYQNRTFGGCDLRKCLFTNWLSTFWQHLLHYPNSKELSDSNWIR